MFAGLGYAFRGPGGYSGEGAGRTGGMDEDEESCGGRGVWLRLIWRKRDAAVMGKDE